MLRKSLFLLLVALVTFSCTKEKKEYTFAFYNVENLFDTINDPNTRDDDFTPEGKLQYTSKRYQDKLDKISKVISSIDNGKSPALIGLCEIENQRVLKDLINDKNLISSNFKIVHIESPDKRGIDCALLYNKNDFKILNQEIIGIEFPWEPEYKTRDILHVQGIIGNQDTLHVFINHWPSRRGGQEKSEKNRIFVASQLRASVDKIQNTNAQAKIIIMGDFNDEPNDRAVVESLKADNKINTDNPRALYNLMFNQDAQGEGTYYFRGNWNMLDNLIVSNSLFNNKNGYHTTTTSGHIFSEEWMCYKNKAGVLTPSRTYGGPNYYGGYSDHFPVYFRLTEN
ncbi:hypothetical protein [Ancylomarina longa]|uniref:Endonuclease/exonuclease/phosphatase domain-containing protein n=1 Tax=Ancylomarina longa TaxID=2487017 RepID=A0A434AUU3_9BACT|nr:hypothetical protein [Ancylomarina longa]RUT78231.1 hypothetical protein DLK05_09130 [Ancylomarina longa]